MNLRLLQQWLELDSEAWPPSHYRLLGLSNGEGQADDVEMRVLQRMEKLRNYQLLHPELVTEGMNRLAQALNCLTDPESRKQYDLSLGMRQAPARPTPPPPVAVPEPKRQETSQNVLPDEIPLPILPDLDEEDAGPRRGRKADSAFRERGGSTTDLNLPKPSRRRSRKDEAAFRDQDEDEPIVLEAVPRESKKKAAPKLPPVQLPPELLAAREADKPVLRERPPIKDGSGRKVLLRTQYREMARLRKVIRVWEKIRQSLASFEKEKEEPVELVELLIALQDLVPLLPQAGHLVGQADSPGYIVATFAKKPSPLELLRSMSPSQRESLSQDCRAAHYRLVEAQRKLRLTLRQGREKGFFGAQVWPRLRLLGDARWLCLCLGGVALLLAAIRS